MTAGASGSRFPPGGRFGRAHARARDRSAARSNYRRRWPLGAAGAPCRSKCGSIGVSERLGLIGRSRVSEYLLPAKIRLVIWCRYRRLAGSPRLRVGRRRSQVCGSRPCRVVRPKRPQDHSQPVAFFRPPSGIPLLKPGPLLRRYPWKNVVFLQSRKRF